jgi:hypothetical protein
MMRDFIQCMAMVVLYFTLLALLPACSTISITSPDGYVGRYSRVGNQYISGLRMEKSADGLYRFELDEQSSDASNLLEIIRGLETK